MKYIKPEIAEKTFKESLQAGETDGQKATIFYSKAILEHRLELLFNSFPQNTLHAVSIKTNNHPDVLKHIIALGYGLEAASLEEVELARAAGASNDNIVFDSPVKTQEEIDYIVKEFSGMYVNANCLEELERYPQDHDLVLGLRINPLVQNEAEGIFDVSSSNSKFGVPITRKKHIVDACIEHKITVLHFHIGSGLKNYKANVRAAEKIVELAKEIDEQRQSQNDLTRITTIDIGGGIYFDLDQVSYSVEAFCKELKNINGIEKYKLITEYGAFIHKHTSFVVSKVEYVIDNGPNVPKLAYLHVGADLFLRKVYSDLNIEYPYSVILNHDTKEKHSYNVVGPLCFAGDVLYENIQLPELRSGDYFVMYNVGANTYSMWSGHCSREKVKYVLC